MKLQNKIICLLFIFVIFISFCNVSLGATNLNILSQAVVLIDKDSGKVLYEKDSNTPLYPASTTKMMTAILVLENCNLTDQVTVNKSAIDSVPYGYSTAYLVEGEVLTVENLLNVLLIPSANDAANVLAEHVGGSIENFAELMNNKAVSIGCKNTYFKNPSGIHDDEHHSTAYDLALIARYAMNIPAFRNIVCKTKCSLPITNKYDKEDRIFTTTNELLKTTHIAGLKNYYYENCIGIKTGYTGKANHCIVAGARKNNVELIAVVLHGRTTEEGLSERAIDCKTLFNYGFSNYSAHLLCKKGDTVKTVTIPNANKDTKKLELISNEDIYATLSNNYNTSSITGDVKLNEKLTAPILEGETVGTITYKINDATYTTNIVAKNDVYVSNFLRYFYIYAGVFIFLFLFAVSKAKSKKRKKRRKKYKHY